MFKNVIFLLNMNMLNWFGPVPSELCLNHTVGKEAVGCYNGVSLISLDVIEWGL